MPVYYYQAFLVTGAGRNQEGEAFSLAWCLCVLGYHFCLVAPPPRVKTLGNFGVFFGGLRVLNRNLRGWLALSKLSR